MDHLRCLKFPPTRGREPPQPSVTNWNYRSNWSLSPTTTRRTTATTTVVVVGLDHRSWVRSWRISPGPSVRASRESICPSMPGFGHGEISRSRLQYREGRTDWRGKSWRTASISLRISISVSFWAFSLGQVQVSDSSTSSFEWGKFFCVTTTEQRENILMWLRLSVDDTQN